MLSVPQLDFGPIDAVNYRQRDNKNLLGRILYKEHFLSEIVKPSKFFLIGEKGTGKTSYSVYLENSDYENTRARVVELGGTDYQKFISLRRSGKLGSASYTDVWKVILLLLMSHAVEDFAVDGAAASVRFTALRNAVRLYYQDAFKPEVDYTLELVQDSACVLQMMRSANNSEPPMAASPSFKINLFALQKQFEDAFSSLKISSNVILFIDGIDIRPEEIGYDEYIECIRGLANATWQINTDLFANIKDSVGRMKVCLLMRPDILDQMQFQNLNAKVRDNGVVLNWQTSYEGFASSAIFKLVSGIISKQQEKGISSVDAWKHYFPYELQNQRISEKKDDPFVGFLRYSFYRPRDIVQYLTLMSEYVAQHQSDKNHFTERSFHKCERDFSEYLLGEVRDYLGFYYGIVDFDQIVGFFEMFHGKNNFSWDEFCKAFNEYKRRIVGENITVDELTGKPEAFLQFLYSLNIIGYLEPDELGGVFVHWCFRDRTPVKLRPKVKLHLNYTVHPGLARSLLVGRGPGSHSLRPARARPVQANSPGKPKPKNGMKRPQRHSPKEERATISQGQKPRRRRRRSNTVKTQ